MKVAYRIRPSGRVVKVSPDAPSHCLYWRQVGTPSESSCSRCATFVGLVLIRVIAFCTSVVERLREDRVLVVELRRLPGAQERARAEVLVAARDDVRAAHLLLQLVRRRREMRVDLTGQQCLHRGRMVHRDDRRVEGVRVAQLDLRHLAQDDALDRRRAGHRDALALEIGDRLDVRVLRHQPEVAPVEARDHLPVDALRPADDQRAGAAGADLDVAGDDAARDRGAGREDEPREGRARELPLEGLLRPSARSAARSRCPAGTRSSRGSARRPAGVRSPSVRDERGQRGERRDHEQRPVSERCHVDVLSGWSITTSSSPTGRSSGARAPRRATRRPPRARRSSRAPRRPAG